MRPESSPVIHLQDAVRSLGHHERLLATGQLLTRWPAAPTESAHTDCFRRNDEFWIWQAGVGGISFRADDPSIQAFPHPDVAPDTFDYIVRRNWLPAVFHIWGRQVIHASAAVETRTGGVVAFVGPSGAGKSTLAYGLGRRPGWAHLADDTVSFSCDSARAVDSIVLHQLPNDARLRPASADHFGRSGPPAPIAWPDGPLRLTRFFVVEGKDEMDVDVRVEPLRPGAAYLRLLGQAHAMTLELPEHNRRLMRDYLHVTATVPVFELSYRRSFDALKAVFDAVARA